MNIHHILWGSLIAIAGTFPLSCAPSQQSTADSISAAQQAADEAETHGPARATLLFVGDAMAHQDQIDRAKELGKATGAYDFSDYYTLIAPAIQSADYAVVNLETPLGGGKGGYTGFPCFSAPDSFAEELRRAGFDLFLTANNHTLDRSDYGLRRTITVLDSLSIAHIGTYRNAAARAKEVPFITDINGIKIGFLNYTYGTNGITAKDGAEVCLIDRPAMAKEIERTRSAGAEFIVVCVHWGVEYQLTENASQRDLANWLIDQGVDMIIGGHPHVVQPMKVVTAKSGKRVPVVYSLGNFISNMKTGDTRGGAMVWCEIERDESGDVHFLGATYDTFYAAKPHGEGTNYQVIPSWEATRIPSGQQGWWHTFESSATRVLDSHNVDIPRHQRE